MYVHHVEYISPFYVAFTVFAGEAVNFIAVASTGLIYLTRDGGDNWGTSATVTGSLTGATETHNSTIH